jgi:hypothetical protein
MRVNLRNNSHLRIILKCNDKEISLLLGLLFYSLEWLSFFGVEEH